MDDATFERLRTLHYLENRIRHTAPVIHAQERGFFDREIGGIADRYGNPEDREASDG